MAQTREQKKTEARSNGSGVWASALRNWRWLWADNGATDPYGDLASAEPKPADAAKSESFTDLLPFKIIAWLGATAAGLTLLLGAIGFLASSAHDVMLGIPRSVQNSTEFVTVGGLFFGRSVIFLVASFISLKSWMVLAVSLIFLVVHFKTSRQPSRGRSLFAVLFGIGLLSAEVYCLDRLIRPLQISNLLLNLSSEGQGAARQIVDALLVRNTTWLSAEYGYMVLLVAILSVAFFAIEKSSRTQFWQMARVPAFILLIVCIFLLPRAYGVLTISNEYPTAVLETSQSNTVSTSEPRLLLREDKDAFVLYDPASQTIATVKRDSVLQHKVYGPQHIFAATLEKR